MPPKVNWPAGWADNPPPMVPPTRCRCSWPDWSIRRRPGFLPTQVITPTVTIPDDMLVGWDSWGTLKGGYTTNYAPLIQALAQSAAPAWQALQTQAEYGYVLRKGESVSYPLLLTVTNVVYEGDAYTQNLVTVQEPAEGDPHKALVFTAVDDVFNQGVPMTATITYEGGTVEVIKVMVVSEPSTGLSAPGRQGRRERRQRRSGRERPSRAVRQQR